MVFQGDGFLFVQPFADEMGPTKGDGEKSQQFFESFLGQ